MATYICPKCNIETTEPKQHAGHKLERNRSVGLSVLAGIGFYLLVQFFLYMMMAFVIAATDDVEGPAMWIFGIVGGLLLGTLPVIGPGIWAIRKAAKYRRSAEPTAKLAPQNCAFGWTLIAMSCASIIFGTIRAISFFYATHVKHP